MTGGEAHFQIPSGLVESHPANETVVLSVNFSVYLLKIQLFMTGAAFQGIGMYRV